MEEALQGGRMGMLLACARSMSADVPCPAVSRALYQTKSYFEAQNGPCVCLSSLRSSGAASSHAIFTQPLIDMILLASAS
jgi:hypothetical protein